MFLYYSQKFVTFKDRSNCNKKFKARCRNGIKKLFYRSIK